MAREHARILCSIWSDPDFKALSAEAQRMYILLLSQRHLNHAGVVPMTVQRWANSSPDTKVDDVYRWLEELAQRRYVVFDSDTDELLVRSFIRNDGVVKQPNVLKAALRLALEVDSPAIRRALAEELRRLDRNDSSRVADALVDGLSHPSGTLPEGFEMGSRETRGMGKGNGEGEEAREELFTTPVSEAPKKSRTYSPEFEAAWAAYERKGGKADAFREWKSAVKRADPERIVEAIPGYLAANPDPKYRKDFCRWLKNDMWEARAAGAVQGRRDPRTGRAVDW